MSPNHVEFDEALKVLREDTPRAEATRRAVQAVIAGPRPISWPKPLAAGLVSVALAAILWPRPSTSGAWAQSVANTLAATTLHQTHYGADGQVSLEQWRQGAASASVLYYRHRKVLAVQRSDGKRAYVYFNWTLGKTGGKSTVKAPINAREVALICDGDDHARLAFELPYESVSKLLSQKGVHVVEHRPEADGRPERYRLKITAPFPSELYAEVDSKGARINRLYSLKGKLTSRIDYPDSISPAVFDPQGSDLPKVETVDLTATTARATERIKQGLGQDGPVTLRLVALDADGALWALWTGAAPDPKLTHPFRVPGVSLNSPFGMKALTSGDRSSVAPSIQKPLEGMARIPNSKIGSTVDVDVPYSGGVAHFRHVPVLRISDLHHYNKVLGLHW